MKNLILIIATLFITTVLSEQIFAQSDKVHSPYFLVRSNNNEVEQMPLKSTSADVNIVGTIADVTITQVYKNEGNSILEAVYVFPGSTSAAVYGMEMKIGNRTIVAEIKEKNQARKEYNEAKSQGKRASLLQQERPNVFQMEVANILPGDRIEVSLKYTELLVPTESVYEFVYPTVVGPRYSESGRSQDNFVSTPYTKNGEGAPSSFDIKVNLNAGMPIQSVTSPSHRIDVDYAALDNAKVGLNVKETNGGNKDFVLHYQLAGKKIASGLMLYEGEKENFFTLVMQPPRIVSVGNIPSREYIFIVDVSGSMSGYPLDVSKKLLRNLISNLRPTDMFNVMLFAGSSMMLSEESLHATPENIQEALTAIDKRRGSGGTRLYPAMKKAIELPRCEQDVSRSMIVITDGFITVEKEVFDLIENNMDKANTFAFGIGSSVNRYLIEGMAAVGQGEAFIVLNKNNADAQAEKFRKYIAAPVLTQIKLDFGGFDVYDVEPKTIPDVLAQRPIIVYGKWKGEPKGKIKLSGYTGGGTYSANFKIADYCPKETNHALKYLWARAKIKRLGDYKKIFATSNAALNITALGLQYNLLTDYTSFLAVDYEEIVKADNTVETKKMVRVKQPLPIPENVSDYAVGFDMAIEGVSRSLKRKSTHKFDIVVKDTLSKVTKKSIENQLEKMIHHLKKCVGENEIHKINMKMVISELGEIVSVTFDCSTLGDEEMECMKESLIGNIFYDVVLPKTKTIEIGFVVK